MEHVERLWTTKVTLTETERALVLSKGRFEKILGPGQHVLPRKGTAVFPHDLSTLRFRSPYAEALIRTRPDLIEGHLTVVRTGPAEIGIVSRNGRPFEVLLPGDMAAYWTDAATWEIEMVDVSASHRVEMGLAQRLTRAGLARQVQAVEVADGRVGVLSVDGVLTELLPAGTYWFWQLGRKHLVRVIDTRWQAHEVSGQEVLTQDRVSIRVNVTASYRVTDPMKAVTEVKDFAEALHVSVGLAFRKTLGAISLDALLADKVSVTDEAAAQVAKQMAAFGVELGEIALKDVILPGEMRAILTSVVEAQKEAEANVIRRREETNATRSLLNTAKVMAENPVMLRLKELEALETIAGKVERLTVHNGTEGLMSDLVKLRD